LLYRSQFFALLLNVQVVGCRLRLALLDATLRLRDLLTRLPVFQLGRLLSLRIVVHLLLLLLKLELLHRDVLFEIVDLATQRRQLFT